MICKKCAECVHADLSKGLEYYRKTIFYNCDIWGVAIMKTGCELQITHAEDKARKRKVKKLGGYGDEKL